MSEQPIPVIEKRTMDGSLVTPNQKIAASALEARVGQVIESWIIEHRDATAIKLAIHIVWRND